MTGSHEVRGSIPLGSTNIKSFSVFKVYPDNWHYVCIALAFMLDGQLFPSVGD